MIKIVHLASKFSKQSNKSFSETSHNPVLKSTQEVRRPINSLGIIKKRKVPTFEEPPEKKKINTVKMRTQTPDTVVRTITTSSELLEHHNIKNYQNQDISQSQLQTQFFEDNQETNNMERIQRMKSYLEALNQRTLLHYKKRR